jgi:hypothetical protein
MTFAQKHSFSIGVLRPILCAGSKKASIFKFGPGCVVKFEKCGISWIIVDGGFAERLVFAQIHNSHTESRRFYLFKTNGLIRVRFSAANAATAFWGAPIFFGGASCLGFSVLDFRVKCGPEFFAQFWRLLIFDAENCRWFLGFLFPLFLFSVLNSFPSGLRFCSVGVSAQMQAWSFTSCRDHR